MPPEQKQPNQNLQTARKPAIRTMRTDVEEFFKTAKPSLGSMITQSQAIASLEERRPSRMPAIIIFSVIGIVVLAGGVFFLNQFLSAPSGGTAATGGQTSPSAQKLAPPAPFFASETSRTITANIGDRPGFARLMTDSMQEKERDGTIKRIIIKVRDGPQERFATMSDFLDFWRISPPPSLADQIDSPLMVFIYYGAAGSRLGFSARTRTPNRTLADVLTWEPGLLSTFTPLFFDEKITSVLAPFEDRTYRNIDWRYLKLSQDRDLGIAHTIFPAGNFLVITTSKEAMETVINRLFDAR